MADRIQDLESRMANARISDGHHDSNNKRAESGNAETPQDHPSWLEFSNTPRNVVQYQEDESDDDEKIVTMQAAGLQPQSRSSEHPQILMEPLY